jgi:hypothetical protein
MTQKSKKNGNQITCSIKYDRSLFAAKSLFQLPKNQKKAR